MSHSRFMSAGFRLWQLAMNTFLLSSFKPVLVCSKTHLTTFCLKKLLHTQPVSRDNFPNLSVAVEHVQVFRIQCRGYVS